MQKFPKFMQETWTVLEKEDDGIVFTYDEDTKDFKNIAQVYHAGKNGTEDGRDNAHIIAFAPEMYEQLHWLLGRLRNANNALGDNALLVDEIYEINELLTHIDALMERRAVND